jgi:hypothetical protein
MVEMREYKPRAPGFKKSTLPKYVTSREILSVNYSTSLAYDFLGSLSSV